MSILLDDKELGLVLDEVPDDWWLDCKVTPQNSIVKATAKKIADKIDSMVADGWFLEDIVKAIRKEIES